MSIDLIFDEAPNESPYNVKNDSLNQLYVATSEENKFYYFDAPSESNIFEQQLPSPSKEDMSVNNLNIDLGMN